MLGAAKTAFGGKAGMDKTTRDSEAVAGTHNKNAQDGTSSRDSAGFGQGAAIDQGQQHSSEMGSRSSSDHSSGSSASTSQGGNSATNGSLGTQASISDSFNNGSKDTITFNRPIDSRGFPELVGMLNTDGRTAFTQQQQSNFSAMTSGIDNATTSAQSAMSAGSSAMSAAAGQVGGGQQAFAGTPSNWQPNMASNIARDYVGNKDAYSGYSSAFESAFSGNKKMAQGIMGTSSDLGMLGQFGHTANAANISIDKGPNVTAGAAAIGTTGAIVYGALQGAKNATIAADTVVAATAVLGPEAFLPAEAITTVVAGAAGAIYGAMHAVE